MTENGTTPEPQQGMLLQFFKDWQLAEQRSAAAQENAQKAQQSALGAANDALVKEARFKGAAELIYGPNATFEYNEKTGLRFIQPNRETRRALAKAAKKK